MTRLCDQCNEPISEARLKHMPDTRLCLSCKTLHDEPPLKDGAPRLAGCMAEASPDDLMEMQAEWRGFGRIAR